MTNDAYTINEFCLAHRFSRATYYNLKKENRGPREMHVGTGVRISREAAAEWRREREAETLAAANDNTEAA